MKAKFLITGIIMITTLVLSAGALFVSKDDRTRFLEQRAQLTMRDIGHRMLLHAGDSSSRVLPVQQLGDNTYRIDFESEFAFSPDTLVKIVHERLMAVQLPLQYMVNVLDCDGNEIVYGYERSFELGDNVACVGRLQPRGCYSIVIQFSEWNQSAASANTDYLFVIALASIVGVAFVGRAILKQPKVLEKATAGDTFNIGKYTFSPERRLLICDGETAQLTDKEVRLLQLFVSAPNEVLSRDYLLKEVWENEGVFVSRSLDMFVSKLRKRFANDPNVRIANVHGKGYKLEISS